MADHDDRPQETGYLRALLDADFDHLVTPLFVKSLYRVLVGLIAIQLSFFVGLLMIFQGWIGWGWSVIGLVMSPIAWFVSSLFLRMALEHVLISFKINENLVALRLATAATRPRDDPPTTG